VASTTPSPSTLFTSAVTSSTTVSSSQNTDSSASGAVGTETEAQRRSQRLARFAALESETNATASTTLKRPATADPDTSMPQKMAKLTPPDANNDTAEEDFDGTEDDTQTADELEATEDEGPTTSAAPSPPPQAE